MHLCHRGIHATKVGSFFVLLILWISCLVSLSSLILHGSWCIHYHSTWAHYLQPYRMAISRDNAEIVAKEIQISLNLFERAEHVLNTEFQRNRRLYTISILQSKAQLTWSEHALRGNWHRKCKAIKNIDLSSEIDSGEVNKLRGNWVKLKKRCHLSVSRALFLYYNNSTELFQSRLLLTDRATQNSP